MSTILFDRNGHVPLPAGYVLVESEVDFLRQADQPTPMMIRGPICDWAETFYRARQIAFQEGSSAIEEIMSVCPMLSESQSIELVDRLGGYLPDSARPLSILKLLKLLYPMPLWSRPLELRHAAEWIWWRANANLLEGEELLVNWILDLWQQQAEAQYLPAYQIRGQHEAWEFLDKWLGIDGDVVPINDEYPLEISPAVFERARLSWDCLVVSTKGAFFIEICKKRIPFSLKKQAAQLAANYYNLHPEHLSADLISQLSEYLDWDEISQLRSKRPPELPKDVPQDAEKVLAWFENEYLPYRQWQHSFSVQDAKNAVSRLAKQFSIWFLENYAQGLLGGPIKRYLSFNKVPEIKEQTSTLTLVIVLDGLHVADGQSLYKAIMSQCPRLNQITSELVFAPIPTITEFAKEALLKGGTPDHIEEWPYLGTVLSGSQSPATRLANAVVGQVYLWRLTEPDATYHHKGTSETLRQDVEGRLLAEASKIKEIVDSIPSSISLQIVITTDHGRLLGNAQRLIPIPPNMTAHGRAAWGESSLRYPAEGFIIKEEMAYLYHSTFGTKEDLAIPLDDSAFRTSDNKGGIEAYPHGGLFPEEVIIPWIVLARDVVKPLVKIRLTGKNMVNKPGTMTVEIENSGSIDILAALIKIEFPNIGEATYELNCAVSAKSQEQTTIRIEAWPSSSAIQRASAAVMIKTPNQLEYEIPAEIELTSDSMHQHKQNALEDLL